MNKDYNYYVFQQKVIYFLMLRNLEFYDKL